MYWIFISIMIVVVEELCVILLSFVEEVIVFYEFFIVFVLMVWKCKVIWNIIGFKVDIDCKY